MTTGQVIRETRIKMGISQSNLATMLGLQQAALSRYELDMRSFPPLLAKKFIKFAKSKKVKISLTDIFPDE